MLTAFFMNKNAIEYELAVVFLYVCPVKRLII